MGSSTSRTDGVGAETTTGTKRICVIGSGSSGLVALKVIKDTPQFKSGQWNAVAFEARDGIGGIWLPATQKTTNGDTDKTEPPITPLYDSLTTNLPHPVMTYDKFPFPASTPLFPKAHVVLEYLQSYAKAYDLTPFIHLNTSVSEVKWTGHAWNVAVKETTSDTETEYVFDYIIVANGHYHVPYYPYPTLPGLDEWRQSHPTRISHSAWYRSPSALGDVGDKVLVIGGGPSGRDIAIEVARADPSRTVIHADPSVGSDESNGAAQKYTNLLRRSRVTRLSPSSLTAHFTSHEPISSITHIILATGYLLSFPFLTHHTPIQSNIMPPPSPPLPTQFYNSAHHLFPLVRDVFPLTDAFPADRMAFLGLPVKVVPFPLEEVQVKAAVKVFANPGLLDVESEKRTILKRYEFLRDEALSKPSPPTTQDLLQLHIAHAFFRYRDHEQFEYREALLRFAGYSPEESKVREWEIEFYDKKEVLRSVWKEIEEKGIGEDVVKGVGSGEGVEEKEREWTELMRKLVRENSGMDGHGDSGGL